jgi:hypothetical protein
MLLCVRASFCHDVNAVNNKITQWIHAAAHRFNSLPSLSVACLHASYLLIYACISSVCFTVIPAPNGNIGKSRLAFTTLHYRPDTANSVQRIMFITNRNACNLGVHYIVPADAAGIHTCQTVLTIQHYYSELTSIYIKKQGLPLGCHTHRTLPIHH